jgi:hypothetical protein
VATVTLTVTGELKEVTDFVRLIGAALGPAASPAVAVAEEREEEGAAAWYHKNAARFVHEVQPKACRAIEYLVKRAPASVRYDELQEAMQVDGPTLAGQLASVKFTCERLNCPEPFTRDPRKRVYQMSAAVAEALRQALDQNHPGS